MNLNKVSRQLHRWATLLVALPLIIMLITGMLLQWKKRVSWVQPPTQRGVETAPTLAFAEILAIAREVDQAAIDTWDDIDRLDVRPGKGVVKIRAKNRWEVQIDAATGAVLQTSYRRSDLIESLHDGSFFHKAAKLWVFFPAALALLLMWITGIYLFVLPYLARARSRARRKTIAPPNA